MGEKGQSNRQRIVAAADRLFYQKGYNQTSFSDIAQAAGLSRGNFYYYFKTKDAILEAVIEQRLDGIRAMLADWDRRDADPRARLQRFVRMLARTEDDILRYGCPMGSLTMELSKTQLALQSQAAQMFELFRQWLEAQLSALGKAQQARALALHLLAFTQGAALIGNVYADPSFLQQEAARMAAWVDGL